MNSASAGLRAALVVIALLTCQCTGGGSGSGEGIGSSCPLVNFSGRTLLDGSGLNLGNDNADTPHLVQLGDKLYATWSEYVTADSTDEIQVSAYNGNDSSPSWTRVATGNGLNYSSSSSALTPKVAVLNNKLYVTWIEDAAGPSVQVRVSVFNGDDTAPAWTRVDGGAATGLNKLTSQYASRPQLVSFDDKLYLFWIETNAGMVAQVRAAVYNGNDSSPAWTFVDGNGANGLNKNSARDADYVHAVVYNEKLYLSWSESNGSNEQVRVAVYGGNDSSPSWSFVDGNGANGLNFSGSQNATQTMLVANARDLAVFWLENGALRGRSYGGVDTSPTWTFIDGNSATGIRVSGTVETPAPFSLGYNLMAAWMEAVGGSVPGLRLAKGIGSWSMLAGSGSAALNYDSSLDAFKPATVVTTSCKVYLVWLEVDSVLGTNRVRAAVLQ